MPLSIGRRVSLLPRSFVPDTSRRRQTTFPLASSSRKKDRRWPLVLRFWKGSIHGTILFPIFLHSLLAAFVVYVNQHITRNFNLPSSIIPSLSIVVGLMLVFRNQTAYSRFWNGRCHLNTVTTAIRCISRQMLVLVPAPPPEGLHSLNSISSEDFLPRNDESRSAPRASQSRIEAGEAEDDVLSRADELKTIETVKILIAMLYTIKNHLRAEWGVALSPGTMLGPGGQQSTGDEYKDLLPQGLKGYEHRGLGLTLELATFVEKFVALGVKKEWFHNAASGSMLAELNALTSAYGSMEVIRLVPIPVAHLIHHKQTLALFCGILPFAMASEMSWWAVPLTAFVSFTLYGIEGIAQTFEDPFGLSKIDINMDDIVDDARREVEVMLTAWRTQNAPSNTSSTNLSTAFPSTTNLSHTTTHPNSTPNNPIYPASTATTRQYDSIFRPRLHLSDMNASEDADSDACCVAHPESTTVTTAALVDLVDAGETTPTQTATVRRPRQSQVRFVFSNPSRADTYTDDDGVGKVGRAGSGGLRMGGSMTGLGAEGGGRERDRLESRASLREPVSPGSVTPLGTVGSERSEYFDVP